MKKINFLFGYICIVMFASGCHLFGSEDDESLPVIAGGQDRGTVNTGAGTTAENLPATEEIQDKLHGPMTDVWKYKDDKGSVYYVDSLKKVPKKYRKFAHHPTGGNVTIIPATPVDDLIKKHNIKEKEYKNKKAPKSQPGEIIVYSTPWCPACKVAKKYLARKGVKFTVKNVERDREALKEMLQKSKGARGVPVIDINGKILRGFSARAIDQALAG